MRKFIPESMRVSHACLREDALWKTGHLSHFGLKIELYHFQGFVWSIKALCVSDVHCHMKGHSGWHAVFSYQDAHNTSMRNW